MPLLSLRSSRPSLLALPHLRLTLMSASLSETTTVDWYVLICSLLLALWRVASLDIVMRPRYLMLGCDERAGRSEATTGRV